MVTTKEEMETSRPNKFVLFQLPRHSVGHVYITFYKVSSKERRKIYKKYHTSVSHKILLINAHSKEKGEEERTIIEVRIDIAL